MRIWHAAPGWLFTQQAPSGVYHLGFSRRDNTLCGAYSIGWSESSVDVRRDHCAVCWAKALRYFPELADAKKAG